MLQITPQMRILVCVEPVDFRNGIEAGTLEPDDFATIDAILASYAYVTHLIDKKSTTLDRPRKLLFGASTEKTADVLGRAPRAAAGNESGAADGSLATGESPPASKPKQPRQGHGRHGAADYPGAKRIPVPHETLRPGDPCPACLRGTVYEVGTPGVLIRLVGQAPLQATIYELQKLRCNPCGRIFTATAPADAGSEKYDATVGSMIGMLKYGQGLPFNRIDGLQENLEIPLNNEERLRFHQDESGPIMERLREWLKRQFDERLVEPHAALGAAIQYLRKHWEKLTLFLRVADAPLDNSICERALKKAILHRKNALFYKTQNGADVGDLHMSLIHTCELRGANPFDYLTQLQCHADEVAAAPNRWLPWNYRDNILST